MMEEIRIGYGAACPEIKVQLEKQGFLLKDCDKYEKVKFGLTFSLFHGFLTESQVNKAFQKMNNEIAKNVVLIDENPRLE